MNRLEFVLMDNPIRRIIQAYLEVKRMRAASQLPPNTSIVLEIGCGSGHGTKLIKKHFKPRKIEAIDLDEKMIRLARRRNTDPSVAFHVGDAAKLDFNDTMFDAIFDFGIIHHIPNWRDCLDELKRVLKPGGELILEDLSIETFETVFGKLLRRLLKHPYEEMFRRAEFIDYLEKIGFKIQQKRFYNTGGLKYFVLTARKNAILPP